MEHFLYPTLTAFFGAFITWFFSWRKTLAQDRAAELDNAVSAVKYYRDLLDDITTRLTAATENIKKMEVQNNELSHINKQLTDELHKLKLLKEKHHNTA
ncbi:hypothetical protein [Flavobacterium sp. KACC 22758]|jgi:hypothetical protein|uniref:hypothetical protein n=1 Tax=unclassified Flavobacterium TaxID=196869 RepID=UPI002365F68C|nr:hypothetical protein [Flavobacterium sp. KACC 22758]WDF60831.1 hypothetical protein PQ462_05575 [Flavobacterium sp. KACC 22758]